MRVALATDWHLGLTKEKAIRNELKAMKNNNPDVIVFAGDFCGGILGHKSVNSIIKFTREYFPDTDIIACLGNHDYWASPKRMNLGKPTYHPSLESHVANYNNILETFKKYNVHFLDTDGVYRNSNFPGVAIVGHSMWYKFEPDSNDLHWMPTMIEGNTHKHLYAKSIKEVFVSLDQLNENDTTRIFVSHFPVIEIDECDEKWNGDGAFGKIIQESYDIKYFLQGHDHRLYTGPIKYSSGSDYGKPRHQMIDV